MVGGSMRHSVGQRLQKVGFTMWNVNGCQWRLFISPNSWAHWEPQSMQNGGEPCQYYNINVKNKMGLDGSFWPWIHHVHGRSQWTSSFQTIRSGSHCSILLYTCKGCFSRLPIFKQVKKWALLIDDGIIWTWSCHALDHVNFADC